MTPHALIMRMASVKKRTGRALAVLVCCGIVLAGGAPVRAAGAEQLFAKHCVACHGKDGRAQSPAARKLGVKDLSISKAADGQIETQLREGKKDERGNQKMPPFKDKLSPEEIKSLTVFVKGFRK